VPRQEKLAENAQTKVAYSQVATRKRKTWSLKTMLCKIQMRSYPMRYMQPKGDKLHTETPEKRGCILTSELHKQMHLEQKKATQMGASFHWKLHKRAMDASERKQSFRQRKSTQSSLQAA
jgi:hypothetical protein